MDRITWTVDGTKAALTAPALAGVIDLDRPSDGLQPDRAEVDERAAGEGTRSAPGRIFGVCGPFFETSMAGRIEEKYVRDDELACTYAATPSSPIQVDLLWRVGTWRDLPETVAVDLFVTVRTYELNCCPRLAVESVVSGALPSRLVRSDDSEFRSLAADGVSPPQVVCEPDALPACFLWESTGPASYAEMVYPADHRRCTFSSIVDDRLATDAVRARHELFADDLEKGVILRSRLRALLTSSSDAKTTAARCFRELAAEPPYLST